MKNSKDINMCEGPLLGNIIRYTVPIICTGILQLLFNAADLVVVGRFCGSVSVAAVGATLAVIYLVVNLFIGLSTGAGVSTAHAIGAGLDEDVHRIIHTAIPTAFLSGLLMTAIGLIGSRSVLELMDTPSDVIELSVSYMRIYFCGMTFSMLYNYGTAILRAAGDTRSPLIYLTIAGVVNVCLNVFFVAVCDMNVAGVALATSISQGVSAFLVIRRLCMREDACRLIPKKLHIYKTPLKKILRIGLPAGIQGSLFSLSNVMIQSSINSFGSIVMSGNAAAANLEGFVYTSCNSFNQTAMNFTGQNLGAGKIDRIKRVHFTCLICVAVLGTVMGGAFYLLGKPLLSIYITDSAEAIKYGLIRITYVCIPYLLCGIMDVTTGTIRGFGVSVPPMLITVLGVCGMRIGWIYTVFRMPQFHSPASLYISYPISWGLTFLVESVCLFIIYRKRIKRMKTL